MAGLAISRSIAPVCSPAEMSASESPGSDSSMNCAKQSVKQLQQTLVHLLICGNNLGLNGRPQAEQGTAADASISSVVLGALIARLRWV